MPKSVAIVLATYNGERYLRAQLESLRTQTLLPDCLVIADDGSQDGTLEIAHRFAKRAPFPVVVHRNATQLGYGENFLNAALQTTTDLVAFADQDDVWLPDKLALSVAQLEDESVMLTAHTATLVDADLQPFGVHHQGIDATRHADALTLDPWGFFSGFTMTFRRRLLEIAPPSRRALDINARDTLTAHDRWVYFLACCLGKTALVSTPLALYRQHGKNLYGGTKLSRLERMRLYLKSPKDELRARAAHYRAVADERVALLEEMAAGEHVSGREACALRLAAEHWSRVRRSEDSRLSLYDAMSAPRQLAHLVRNVADGTYRGANDQRLRGRAMARDLLSVLSPG